MSPERIGRLLDAWRDAERLRDSGPQYGTTYTDANDAVERARLAYLEAITERARSYGYAGGQRTIQDDIDHLREAEDRRTAAQPSTPDHHAASKDVEERALRILIQVIEDDVAAERGRKSKASEGFLAVTLEDADAELLVATPRGWQVGRPSFHEERNVWVQYAFDATERPRPGKPRKRDWKTEAPTQELCIRSMARCLREIAAGRVPK